MMRIVILCSVVVSLGSVMLASVADVLFESVPVPDVISHRTVTLCPVSGALTVASRSTVEPPLCSPSAVVIVTVGARLAPYSPCS